MKTFVKTFLIILPLMILTSCVNKEKTIKSTSPDGSLEIKIVGKKTSIASPWALTIVIKKEGKVNTLTTEMYTDEPDQKNILVNWRSNTNCIITLIEQDGAKRTIPVTFE